MNFRSALLLIITLCFILNSTLAQNSQGKKSISFIDYGPVAFDSFWRLPDHELSDELIVDLASRISSNEQQGFYYTQYFRTDIPIGGNHTITFRIPYHYFNVSESVANELDMDNTSGTEFGDIDIMFNIRFLKKFLEKRSKNLSIYLTGEMHTAPTARGNRQFIDLLKNLGTVNVIYHFLKTPKNDFKGTLCLGGGGWDDFVAPYQKHVIKLSAKMSYKRNLSNEKGLSLWSGSTLLYAEGNNNKGVYWKSGLDYRKNNGIELGLNVGFIDYFEQKNNYVRQFELTALIPINIKANKKSN